MIVDGFELRRLRLPLVSAFRSATSTERERDVLLVRLLSDGGPGWAECVAPAGPYYTAEYVDGAAEVSRRFLFPCLAAAQRAAALPGAGLAAHEVAAALAPVKGHAMAKAAVETAILDAELRRAGTSLGAHLGAVRDRVPAGVAVGVTASVPELVEAVGRHLDEGYRRVKLKIHPGWDVEPVRAVRERFGDGVALQVDANGAYTTSDAGRLAALDPFDLVLIEQPLAPDDLCGHAELARRLRTPLCLDESITSAPAAAAAIAARACAVVNVKPGRVGGYLEARRVHDVCAAAGVPVWCGGMLETGVGRAGNLALAALPNFTLVGDLSASARYYHRDLTAELVLDDGHIAVPTGPGLGVEPLPDVLAELTTSVQTVRA